MSNSYDYNQDSWDQDMYRTGRTAPRKNSGGLVAVLLVLVILLLGIISVLSFLNIKLFRQLQTQEQQSSALFSNTAVSQHGGRLTNPTDSTAAPTPDATVPAVIDLEPTPSSQGTASTEGCLSLQEIYTKLIDSVVSISCAYPNGSSSGTGLVLTADGYLVTNCHVVSGASYISVLFTDGREMPAALVGADEISDLAVLYVDAGDLIPATLGDSSSLRVGDTVVAIGDPLGIELRGTMTDGIVSAINRDITLQGRTMSVIQTNAALNSGNSGGPLINCYGQVIGINTMKIGDYVNSAGVEGLGFAIPSTTVKEIVNQLIGQGYVSGRATLGLTGEDVSGFYQLYYRLPAGFYITEVDPDSSCWAAGIRAGDIVTYLDDQRISGTDDLKAFLYNSTPGNSVTITIYRSGKSYTGTVTVEEANQ